MLHYYILLSANNFQSYYISQRYLQFEPSSFTANCKTITLVFNFVPNIQDDGQEPEVVIT